MTHLANDRADNLDQIRTLIDADSPEIRHCHEPSLRHAIERLQEEGEAVPAHIKELHATLLSEAIEAEFDNMPV